MSGMRRRETIHVSFGGTSNAVTAHLLNLEGLSATSEGAGRTASAVCDPVVTHSMDHQEHVWVPRVLFVDEAHRIQRAAAAAPEQQSWTTIDSPNQVNNTQVASSVWGGAVEEFAIGNSFDLTAFSNVDDVVTGFSFNSNDAHQQSRKPRAPWLSSWQQTARQLAYAPYSQYRVSEEQKHQQYQYHHQYSNANQQRQTSEEQQSRHVDWDDLGDEPEENEEERAALLERQRRQQMQQWSVERQQLEDRLATVWNPAPPSDRPRDETEEATSTTLQESDLTNLAWFDYWMPPYPSPLSQCTYGLPSTSTVSSYQAPPLHSYSVSSHSDVLDDVWEKMRLQLERTDSCQGFTIMTEGSALYAGMANWLLQELQQECRAAGRWVFQIATEEDDEDGANNNNMNDPKDVEDVLENQENAQTSSSSRSTELSRAQARVRNQVQQGLALAGLSDNAHVLLPLILPAAKDKSLFRASAELAMALEAATLPYRCQPSEKTLVGWNSMSGYEEGSTPTGMSLGDYLMTLQPSPRYSLLELDSVMSPSDRQRLPSVLAGGTSVERDPRMRQPPRSAGTTEYPGAWLLDAQFVGSSSPSPPPGILTSLSPGHVAQQDRSLHHHYGLSSCLRRGVFTNDSILTANQQYLTCMMEGMGIRYRPETAFGLVSNQSLTQMTTRGYQYGAGSYWHYLLGDPGNGHGIVDVPVLSVLGNTTRLYPYLHSTSSEMKDALKSSKNRGFYQREVSNGTLPESEDCDESLEYCWNLRDVYEPPHGSGLADGDEEEYFDL